jgi:hypothetical protein
VAALRAKGFGENSARVFADPKSGKLKAAFVDPEEIRDQPRWRTLLRFAGANVKAVDRAGYQRAVKGEEGRFQKLMRAANK